VKSDGGDRRRRRDAGNGAAPRQQHHDQPDTGRQGDILGLIGARGYYSGAPSDYSPTGNAQVEFQALDSFTTNARGTTILLRTTPFGSPSIRTEATIGPGLTVGPVSGTVPGGMQQGDINASGRIMINGTPVGGGPGGGLTSIVFASPLTGGTVTTSGSTVGLAIGAGLSASLAAR
jgi:hypothetical protein